MSYTFKNLADIELLTEMPENANKIIEVDGSIKRISDATSSATPVIIEGTMDGSGNYSFTCTSTTFAEVKAAIENNIPVTGYITLPIQGYGYSIYAKSPITAMLDIGNNLIFISFPNGSSYFNSLVWSPELGIVRSLD